MRCCVDAVYIYGLDGGEWDDGNGAGALSDATSRHAPADASDDARSLSVCYVSFMFIHDIIILLCFS